MKKVLFSITAFLIYQFAFSQNVGIGTPTPAYKLDVVGNVHNTGNLYIDGALGVGTTSPNYKLQVTDGAFALFNSSDVKSWYFNYTTTSGGYFYLAESGVNRFTVANGGNVGIGTSTPSSKLDVVGNAEINGNATVTGNTAITGNLTVSAGKGVLYNLQSSSPVKYYTREAGFTVTNLAAHSVTVEASIGFIGGFSQAPSVFVGDIVSTSGTVGPLYQLQLIIYDVTATGCHCRLLNTSNSTITQNCNWNITCIGY